MNIHQNRLYKKIIIASFLSLIITVICIVFAMINVINENQLNNNIFEIFYMGIHVIITVLLIILSIDAIIKKPFILKTLTIKDDIQVNKVYKYVGLVIGILGVAMSTVSLLVICKAMPNFWNFPTFLNYDLLCSGVNLVIIGFSFFLFPFAYIKDNLDLKINKIKGVK